MDEEEGEGEGGTERGTDYHLTDDPIVGGARLPDSSLMHPPPLLSPFP